MSDIVCGLSVLTPTQDGRTVRELAAESRKSFSDHMREAVAMAVEEEELLEQRRRATCAARSQRACKFFEPSSFRLLEFLCHCASPATPGP